MEVTSPRRKVKKKNFGIRSSEFSKKVITTLKSVSTIDSIVLHQEMRANKISDCATSFALYQANKFINATYDNNKMRHSFNIKVQWLKGMANNRVSNREQWKIPHYILLLYELVFVNMRNAKRSITRKKFGNAD
ncbi:CLUMA_CG015017, isoform A [Clunio marinus]|uniref:CLUMA_CG015017, isoform A n=1 Tax=Clunio marinus TaxID=568069 RepID=A0A1J1ITG6_9DIPT|nr:CLUMA_CG015017, isoform A [Clunio marinus]